MSEETNKTTADFWTAVRGAVESQSTSIPQTVRNHYVEIEISARVKLTIAAFDELKTISSNIKKIQPDSVAYDIEGKVVSSGFSKAKLDERKKLIERQEKLEKALESAFAEKPNFELLKNAKPGSKE